MSESLFIWLCHNLDDQNQNDQIQIGCCHKNTIIIALGVSSSSSSLMTSWCPIFASEVISVPTFLHADDTDDAAPVLSSPHHR